MLVLIKGLWPWTTSASYVWDRTLLSHQKPVWSNWWIRATVDVRWAYMERFRWLKAVWANVLAPAPDLVRQNEELHYFLMLLNVPATIPLVSGLTRQTLLFSDWSVHCWRLRNDDVMNGGIMNEIGMEIWYIYKRIQVLYSCTKWHSQS